jgi:hypothetical protein
MYGYIQNHNYFILICFFFLFGKDPIQFNLFKKSGLNLEFNTQCRLTHAAIQLYLCGNKAFQSPLMAYLLIRFLQLLYL